MLNDGERAKILERLQERLETLKKVNEQLVLSALRSRDLVEGLQRQKQATRIEFDRLHGVVDSMPDELWFCDADARISPANLTAASEIGLGETVGTGEPISISEWLSRFAVTTPEGRPQQPEEVPLVRSLHGERINAAEEIVRQPSTGRLLRRQVNSAPVRDRVGNIVGAVAVVRNLGYPE